MYDHLKDIHTNVVNILYMFFIEGVDFVEKISIKDDRDFTKLRRDLKEIVKAKVRNNQRKNRPFKKKLGGSKKKKMLRIKRALKR